MVEAEIKTEDAKGNTTEIDVSELVGKVRALVDDIREMAGKPMDVRVDSFNVTFGKAKEEYNLAVDTKIIVKPK